MSKTRIESLKGATIRKQRFVILLSAGILISHLALANESPQPPSEKDNSEETTMRTFESPSWPEISDLWQNAQKLPESKTDLWEKSIARIGDYDNTECKYKRHTAPYGDNQEGYPRVYIEAALNSLTRPGMAALGSWFDTPAMHDIHFWHEEVFDPSNYPMWQLISMNSEQPTPAQFKSYKDEKEATVRRLDVSDLEFTDRRSEIGFHPASMQKMLHLRKPTHILHEDDKTVYLGTTRDKNSPIHMHGVTQVTWAISKVEERLLWFDERLLKPHWPHFGVRFKSFNQRGVFEPDPTVNADVLTHYEYDFRARLTLVFDLPNQVRHWYSDFDCTTSG